jgi:hypothetical protein
MGFDYYVYTQLVIVFKDEKKDEKTKNIRSSGGYLWDFDRDELTYEEALEREMARHEKMYPPKLVYSDDKWISKNHEEYTFHLKNVDLSTVSTVTKRTYCVPR